METDNFKRVENDSKNLMKDDEYKIEFEPE